MDGVSDTAGGFARLIVSRDETLALSFVGFSGVGSVIRGGSINGPLLLVDSTADAPVLVRLPLPVCAFFVVALTSSLNAALTAGLAFVSVSTPTFPGGALRGAFPPVNTGIITMSAFLSGAQQWPAPVQSAAFGVATVVVDAALLRLTISLRLSTFLNATGVHIHSAGTLFGNAPPVLSLPSASFGPTTFAASSALVDGIISGRAYINVRTAAFAAGVACLYTSCCGGRLIVYYCLQVKFVAKSPARV